MQCGGSVGNSIPNHNINPLYAAEQQLQHQGYRTIPIFSDFLLVQPGEPQQIMSPVNSTMGIRTLITFGSKMMTMSPRQLKTELSPQILKTEGKDQQLVALVRMMEGSRK